ncbi:amidase [Actinomadura sp. LCR2-06]|uniref:Amidase n=2 Tax=Actinomadura violacea TaxID=2819934 RepID=A0ABS3RLC9_9ACTN|nr:amidase [Actinomadura violacea]
MYLTIADAGAALRAGETTSVDLVRAALAVADARDAALGVHLARFDDAALAAAARADAELAAGADRGPLHGIPMGIKDLIAAAEGETTAQSLVLDREWGRERDAPAVARLRAAGAVITGKTTTMEFGIGAPDPAKPFPVPRNPWSTAHYPGGSSSGSAAGVAAGMFLGGLGTDSAGSVRYPAALCGVTGLKPTFGRVPKNGCVPLGPSYDHVGPLARTAEDCAAILTAVAGHDARDTASSDRPAGDYRGALTGSLAGLRIGVDPLLGKARERAGELDSVLVKAVAELRAAGASAVPIRLPYYRELTTVTRLGMAAEAFAYHRNDLRRRWSDYGAGTRLALAKGALLSAADFVQLQRVRRAGQRALAELFTEVDLIVTPTASCGAPRIEHLGTDDMADAALTAYWNAVGNPVLSVPIGFTRDGLPLGMQIAGRPFEEAAVLAAGHAYQQRTGWHRRVPDLVRDLLAA